MANYSTDFTEYATGAIPSDWTARWDATTQFTVETGGANQILKGLLGASNRHACTWNAVDADADRANVEVLTKFRTLSVSTTPQCGVVVRASGTATTETGYAVFIDTTNLALQSYVSATSTRLVTQTLALLANTDYFLRFRANSTALQARIWLATDAEPTTWDIDTTNTSVSAAGWNGVFAFSNVSDPEYDTIAIATNGDTASAGATIVSTTHAGAWSVRNTVSTTQAGAFSVRNLAAATQDGGWTVRNTVAAAQAGAWSIFNLAATTQDSAWSVRNLVSTTKDGAWSVLAAGVASTTQAGAWSVRNLVSTTKAGAWSVLGAAGTVSTTQPGAWSVRNLVTTERAGAWSVRNLATLTRADTYATLTRADTYATLTRTL